MTYQHQKPALLRICIAALAVVFILYSCKKDEPAAEAPAQLAFVAEVLKANDRFLAGSVNMGQGASEKGSGFAQEMADDRCGSLTASPLDPNLFPKVLLFDFGAGCTDAAGVTRAGSFTLSLDKLWAPGTTSSVKYANYVENGVTLDGSFSLGNVSNNQGVALELKASGLKRIEANGDQSSVDGSVKFQQIEGALSFWDWNDDVYHITGATEYAFSNGSSAKISITVPLRKPNNCAWVNQGNAEIILNGETYLVDYGNGFCDNKALVTYNGNVFEITL